MKNRLVFGGARIKVAASGTYQYQHESRCVKTESFSQLLKAISSESFQSQLVRDHFLKEFSKIVVLRASTVKTMRSWVKYRQTKRICEFYCPHKEVRTRSRRRTFFSILFWFVYLLFFFSFSHNVKTECCLFGTPLHAKVKSASFYQAILCETIPGLNIPAAASY